MADQNELLKTVIQVLNDGARGFADTGEKLKDPAMKAYFLKESQTRGTFARELETASGMSGDTGGTATGTLHRTWADLKANLGGGDHTLLESAEQGEDAAKKAYQKALEDTSLPADVRSLLSRQEPHIIASHDQVRAFRDSTN